MFISRFDDGFRVTKGDLQLECLYHSEEMYTWSLFTKETNFLSGRKYWMQQKYAIKHARHDNEARLIKCAVDWLAKN